MAVPLPEELRAFVENAQAVLPARAGLRLLRPDQLHVTLAFIGEGDEKKVSAAQAVVESLPIDMGGIGMIRRFLMLPSPEKTRVIALEVDDCQGVFGRLFTVVMEGLEAAQVMRREKRPFKPHITVARLKTPGLVQPRSESGEVKFAVKSVCLYRSELMREGARYTMRARKEFAWEEEAKA